MSTRALIGIEIPDVGCLVTHVSYEGDEALAEILTCHYSRREDAANLISLGTMFTVGPTITECIVLGPDIHRDAVLCPTPADVEREFLANEDHGHIFLKGRGWVHQISAEEQMRRSFDRK